MNYPMVIRREPLFTGWLIVIFALLFYKLITLHLILGLAMGAIFAGILYLMLQHKIIIKGDHFIYKDFSQRRVRYDEVNKIFLRFDKHYGNNNLRKFWVDVILTDGKQFSIPSYLFTTKKSKGFFDVALNKNTDIIINSSLINYISSKQTSIEKIGSILIMTLFTLMVILYLVNAN